MTQTASIPTLRELWSQPINSWVTHLGSNSCCCRKYRKKIKLNLQIGGTAALPMCCKAVSGVCQYFCLSRAKYFHFQQQYFCLRQDSFSRRRTSISSFSMSAWDKESIFIFSASISASDGIKYFHFQRQYLCLRQEKNFYFQNQYFCPRQEKNSHFYILSVILTTSKFSS